jgi:hypothetical protein
MKQRCKQDSIPSEMRSGVGGLDLVFGEQLSHSLNIRPQQRPTSLN